MLLERAGCAQVCNSLVLATRRLRISAHARAHGRSRVAAFIKASSTRYHPLLSPFFHCEHKQEAAIASVNSNVVQAFEQSTFKKNMQAPSEAYSPARQTKVNLKREC